MLEIRSISSRYGRIEALHGIDLDVKQGQLVALVGANGLARRPCCGPFPGFSRPRPDPYTYSVATSPAFRPTSVSGLYLSGPGGRHVFGPMSIEDTCGLERIPRPQQSRR